MDPNQHKPPPTLIVSIQPAPPKTLPTQHEPTPAPTKYGIPPRMKTLIKHQGRKYFDSGDFPLSSTQSQSQSASSHNHTADGSVETGTDHPLRESISRPYAPVPTDCNVQPDANRVFGGEGMGMNRGRRCSSSTFESVRSPLAEGGDGWLGHDEGGMEDV
ncbi:hypothetical protein BJY04DRAFT_217682 [Aspergillus karnatakaensis]|uniref:uncharacterized protein n=1 Tax=Aspergillus karnatakaensis TaxID=1810916 RepID=UPI003CCDA2F7